MNESYTWTYDDAGNILSKYTYAFTTGTSLGSIRYDNYYGYEYDTGWDDRLVIDESNPITYDEIGNPTKIVTYQYWDNANSWAEYGYELEWNGRQLMRRRYYDIYCGNIWYDEYYDLSFEYNADGIRTSKTVYETEYKYLLNGTQIIGETWTEYGTEYLLLYLYDENGSPMGIKYRTSAYTAGTFDYFFFEKNLQGDIVAIYNAEGEKIGSYVYDAWGNFTVSTVSGNTSLENSIVNSYNPFRYRGYYYDKDLGWYYLQTRYYNPQWGRFINADGYVSTGQGLLSYNMFVYCNNNPVMHVDPTGEASDWFKLATGLIMVATVAAVVVIAAPVVVPVVGGTAIATIQTVAMSTSIAFACGSVVAVAAGVTEEVYDASKEEKINKSHEGSYTVYTLIDPNTLEVAYVGRTKNLAARINAHNAEGSKTQGLALGVVIPGLTYTQARGLEQVGILTYNTIRLGKNSINGIASGNPNGTIYLRAAWDYLYNQVSNELYNIVGV